MQFGLFDWLDLNPRFDSLADAYEQRLRVLEYADEAGLFWGYHLAEHHKTPLGMAPSPSVFLSAVARSTQRLRLGPMVYLLPLYQPERLVQEICMLDHLSRGRLELGIGRGASPYEMEMFDVRVEDTKQMFDEALAIILQGLSTGHMDYQGKFFSVKNADVPLRPYQRPYPPLWYPTNNPDTTAWLAHHGFSYLVTSNLRRTSKTVAEQVEDYRRYWAEANGKPGRFNGHVSEPKYGSIRHIFVADTDGEARRLAREAWQVYSSSYAYLWKINNNSRHDDQADFDQFVEGGWIFAGSPETVQAGVERTIVETGCNYLATCFTWGNFTTEQMLRSMELFTTQVAPRLRTERQDALA